MKNFGTPWKYATGLLGSTEPGQRVTQDNLHTLPCGSVVRNGDGSIIIHLHDNLWYWRGNNSWLYDDVARMKSRLDDSSVACHIGPMISDP